MYKKIPKCPKTFGHDCSSVVQYSKLIKMSCLFANLVAIRQGKEMIYCFLEARLKLFSGINENHLNYAINFLGINTIIVCTEPELLFLERSLPQFAPFNLLCLHRLLLDFSHVESKM